MRAKIIHIYMLAALGFTLFLLLALVAFEIIPVTNGNDDLIITSQANFQIARVEFLTKDVLILTDKNGIGHAQAIGELQIILPQFEQVQTGLANGDPVLGLPAHPSDSVVTALSASQNDYLAITTATKAILAQPDASVADPTQVNIVRQHEQAYTREMVQVVTLIYQNAEARKIQLLLVELAIKTSIGVLIILKYLLFTRGAIEKMITQESQLARSDV